MAQRSTLQKFPQVDHHEAAGVLGEVYEDIHNTLRVPWVAFAIRVMFNGGFGRDSSLGCGPQRRVAGWPNLRRRPSATRGSWTAPES